jgi:hypothetical protein
MVVHEFLKENILYQMMATSTSTRGVSNESEDSASTSPA